ncbi:MAG: hypothetical protein F6J86_46245 [Symploca sp. SIO1B1]|nr:hypothetical protein [Symploca sp. SIO1B1]
MEALYWVSTILELSGNKAGGRRQEEKKGRREEGNKIRNKAESKSIRNLRLTIRRVIELLAIYSNCVNTYARI